MVWRAARHHKTRAVLATLQELSIGTEYLPVTLSKWEQAMAAEAMVELAQEFSAAVELLQTAASTP
jgi:hypothetical protein